MQYCNKNLNKIIRTGNKIIGGECAIVMAEYLIYNVCSRYIYIYINKT